MRTDVSASVSDLVQRPSGWMVQRDLVDPPQYLCENGEWVLTAGTPTWFRDADSAQAAHRPTGTTGTVVQMWFADGRGSDEPKWRIERRRRPRVA
jgi:hypothetical protein